MISFCFFAFWHVFLGLPTDILCVNAMYVHDCIYMFIFKITVQ